MMYSKATLTTLLGRLLLLILTAFNLATLVLLCAITGGSYTAPYVISLVSLSVYIVFIILALPKELNETLSLLGHPLPKVGLWQLALPKLWQSASRIYATVVTIIALSIFFLFGLVADTEKNVRDFQYERELMKWFLGALTSVGNPDNVEGYLLYNGRNLMNSGDLLLAEKHLLAAVSYAKMHNQIRYLAEANIELSKLFTKLRLYGAARVRANEALALAKERRKNEGKRNKAIDFAYGGPTYDELAAYSQIYSILLKTNKFLDASRICREALLVTHYESDTDTWLKNLAMCYLNSGRAIDAEKIYQKLLRKEGARSNQSSSPFEGFALQEQADIFWALAKIQFERDHTLEALKSLDQAISIGLKNPDGRHSSYVAHITIEMLNRKITMLEESGDSEKIKEVEKIRDEYLKDHNPFFDFENGKYYLGEYTRIQIQNEALEATRVLLERKSTYYWEEINILEKQHANAKGVASMRQSGLLPNDPAELNQRRERLVSNSTYDQLLIRKIGEPRKVNNDTVSCDVAAELWSTKKKEGVPCRLRYIFSLDPKSLSIEINGVQILNQFKWTS